MLINGVDASLRGGDCLKQSLAFLLNIDIERIPNFHRYPQSTWREAFFSWTQALGKPLQESNQQPPSKHIAVYRLKHKETGEWYPLHAVVCEGDKILFDILEGKNADLEYSRFVRSYVLSKSTFSM